MILSNGSRPNHTNAVTSDTVFVDQSTAFRQNNFVTLTSFIDEQKKVARPFVSINRKSTIDRQIQKMQMVNRLKVADQSAAAAVKFSPKQDSFGPLSCSPVTVCDAASTSCTRATLKLEPASKCIGETVKPKLAFVLPKPHPVTVPSEVLNLQQPLPQIRAKHQYPLPGRTMLTPTNVCGSTEATFSVIPGTFTI